MLFYKLVFWLSLADILYAYGGYYLLLKIVACFRNRPVQKGDYEPQISIIIAAYNEKARLREKIQNTLQITYPADKREIIVASDCSTDGTDDIVRSFASEGVKLVRPLERKGKEHAQFHAVGEAAGEILVFTDVATIIEPHAITEMMKNFADPTVGCVSSEDKTIDEAGVIQGESLYVQYEMALRRLETQVNSLVGLSGSFFAARKRVCQDWRSDLQSDFNTLFNSVKQKLRGVSDPAVIGMYKNIKDSKKEFSRKVRTVVRGINVFFNNDEMLDMRTYGFFSVQIVSHKLIRWLVPFELIFIFLANILLLSDPRYVVLFVGQCLFYICAVGGMWSKAWYLRIPYFFVSVNASILVAWVKYMRGERFVSWEPSKR